MEISGADLIARIQSMVQIGLRSKHRELADHLGILARPELAKYGLESKAGGLFDLFRKCKRDLTVAKREHGESPTPVNDLFITLLWKETGQGWGLLDQSSLKDLWQLCEGEFENLLTEFNASRSQATHVLAIFRPLNEKFFLDWAASVEGFDEKERARLAEGVKSAKVHDRTELGIWANEMYNLFSSAAIFDTSNPRKPLKFNRELSSLVGSGKQANPPGMISEPSERIYRQQWRLWIRENEDELLQAMRNDSSRAVQPVHVDQIESSSTAPELRLGQSPISSEPANQVEISLALDSDPTLTASRVWSSNRNAISEVASWLNVMSSAWDSDESPLRVSVRFKDQDGNGELTMRAKNFKEAPKRIENLLTAMDSEHGSLGN